MAAIRGPRSAALVLCVIAWAALPAGAAGAAQIYTYNAGATAGRPARQRATVHGHTGPARVSTGGGRLSGGSAPAFSGPPRAPSGAPLVAGSAGSTSQAGTGFGESTTPGGDAAASASTSGGDPLVENGLGSPLCGDRASDLSGTSRRNCETSGFEAAAAPTGDYGLDVHINTGALGFTMATLEQDYLIAPVWMSLVWVVHVLIVALEWCFTLDLLDSAAMGGVERALRTAQASFTRPWLVLALALASLAAAYDGLVRRRVAETLGQAALMLAMMAGGLWVIADPSGTVGALGQWVDEASLGTLGTVVQGSPAQASRPLAESMGGLFAGVVGAPWCYLEFGNVRWCTDPALLDPRLRAAGLRIAAAAQSGCADGGEEACKTLGGEPSSARAQSAVLLRRARTNGELFLALPADQAARNSIHDSGSLLSVLCGGSEEATECRGPTAREAEFRTAGGTDARVGGLLMIAIGALGMILLLGCIVLHLLGTELMSLLYLLLAPAAVIAPALGERGRAAFRLWGTRLLGAVASKLLFSFVLGVVLLLTRTVMELSAFGWWTRWLLVTFLWWASYRQRHQALSFTQGARGGAGASHRSIVQRAREQLEGPARVWRGAQWVRGKLSKPAPTVERRRARERVSHERARARAREQAGQMLEHEHGEARARAADAAQLQALLSSKRAQLQRVRGAEGDAEAAGDTRRAALLGLRAQRIEGEIGHQQETLNAARRTAAEGDRTRRRTGRRYTSTDVEERGRFLDAQAALPASGLRNRDAAVAGPSSAGGRSRGGGGRRRDYAALASLVGYGREQYLRLDPHRQREARLAIDRELALRRELGAAAADVAASAEGRPPRGERRKANRDFDRALEQRLRNGGHEAPRSPAELHLAGGSAQRRRSHQSGAPDARTRPGSVGRDSPVLRDAHEVARRRKRQLGG